MPKSKRNKVGECLGPTYRREEKLERGESTHAGAPAVTPTRGGWPLSLSTAVAAASSDDSDDGCLPVLPPLCLQFP